MTNWPGDLATPRDETTGQQLAEAVGAYLLQVSGDDAWTVVTGFPLGVLADSDRKRVLVLASAADHADGDTALAKTTKAVVEELGEMGFPNDRILITGHLRWSPDGRFPQEFGKMLDSWLHSTDPERTLELNEQFEREIREQGN